MTGGEGRSVRGTRPEGSQPQSQLTAQPPTISHHSSSLPPTPTQHAQDFRRRSRTPSPLRPAYGHSPRSANSESSRTMPSLRPINPVCRYQSTQTSRRRMPYTIGTDVLEKETGTVKDSLEAEDEKNLCASMDNLYDQLLPTPDSQENRVLVVDKIRHILREEWPERQAEVTIFGSSGNLLYTNQSDVDICITVRGLESVCALADLLARRGMRNVTCVHAKSVPIVKIWDPEYHVACDLNVNNLIALRNTDMVRAYMEVDDRVRPLAMIVKYWTNRRVINEASAGTLSSYTWTLLLISFLQTRPVPILPVFSLTDPLSQPKVSFAEELEQSRGFGSANEESIGQLLFQFFRRYGHEIDYELAVVSVRRGGLITKQEKNWHLATNNRLCVEEPFNTDRNLANTADDTAFRGLHLELRRAFDMISNAKDLVADVFEQFLFPVEGPRTIFERPQPQPRPILSRSTSQSGRSMRGGARGNRRGQETRNGPSGRRSSSAAAFGHTAFPSLQGPPVDVAMPDLYPLQRQANSLSSDELSRLSRQISVEQQHLRQRQVQLAQAQLQQTYGLSHVHGGASTLPHPARQSYSNSLSSPRLTSMEHGPPGSAPLYPAYPFRAQFESPITASYPSSQQGTSTNPNSPLLTPATPYRRNTQRATQASSAGNTARSHSQPARPLAPQLPGSSGARLQYPAMTLPHMPVNIAQSAYMGPYMGQYGAYYVAMPTAESLPRDYLGYGIGGEPQSASVSQAQTPAQLPVYDDALHQSQHLLPLQRTSSMASSILEPPRSPSPLAVSSDDPPSLRSAPINIEYSNQAHESLSGRDIGDKSAPMIVNGSNIAHGNSRLVVEKTGLDDRRVSDPTSGYRAGPDLSAAQPDLRRSPQSFAARVGASLAQQAQQGQRRQEFQRPNFLNAEELDEPVPVVNGSVASVLMPSAPNATIPSMDMPPPPRPPVQQKSPNTKAPEATNEPRRNTGSSRPVIPPLDLGASSTTSDRAADPRPTGSFLSPVQETRTPSPTSHRKHGHSKSSSIQSNGTNGASSASFLRNESSFPTLSAPPTRPKSIDGRNGANGTPSTSAYVRQTSPANVAAPGPSKPPQQQNNVWQQAGKGKKGKGKKSEEGSEKKGGGQVMPENIAERKGG